MGLPRWCLKICNNVTSDSNVLWAVVALRAALQPGRRRGATFFDTEQLDLRTHVAPSAGIDLERHRMAQKMRVHEPEVACRRREADKSREVV